MSEQKHTPGPWKAVASMHFESGLTYVSVQPVLADADRDKALAMANGEFHVCRMSHTAALHRVEVHKANARLIAAAPDLLSAAKAMMDRWPAYQHEGAPFRDEAEGLRAAIAKAEGRQ